MPDPIIRPASGDDLPGIAALWRERMTLRQQTDSRFVIAPDGASTWMKNAAGWLANPDYAIYVADLDATMVGYIVARIEDSPPGLLPTKIGVVVEMAVGAHSYQSGLGRHLLQPVRSWFADREISQFVVYVPHRTPVEQAFWRAVHAPEMTDIMWMKV